LIEWCGGAAWGRGAASYDEISGIVKINSVSVFDAFS